MLQPEVTQLTLASSLDPLDRYVQANLTDFQPHPAEIRANGQPFCAVWGPGWVVLF